MHIPITVTSDFICPWCSSENDAWHALERTALERGIQGVPYFDIGGINMAGAQPAEIILQTIIEAAGRRAPRPAA